MVVEKILVQLEPIQRCILCEVGDCWNENFAEKADKYEAIPRNSIRINNVSSDNNKEDVMENGEEAAEQNIGMKHLNEKNYIY